NCELASRRASARESTISAVPICQWRYLRDLLPPDEFLFVLGEFVVEPPDFVSIARLGLTQAAVFEHPTLSLPVQPPVLLHALLLRRRAFASRRRSSGVGAERAAPSTMTRPDESRTIFDGRATAARVDATDVAAPMIIPARPRRLTLGSLLSLGLSDMLPRDVPNLFLRVAAARGIRIRFDGRIRVGPGRVCACGRFHLQAALGICAAGVGA